MVFRIGLIFQFLLWSTNILVAQHPSDYLGEKEINVKFLEHLVKAGVDSVRQANGLTSLINDSILYTAADHHGEYLKEKNSISHYERDQPKYETPQLRAEAYGAINYAVGENVLKSKYNRPIKSKGDEEKIFPADSYGSLAAAIVDGWVNSPRHFENMLTPDYTLTGLSIAVNIEKQYVYAVQKFASKRYEFTFEENKEMFPYSDYVPDEPASSFDGIPRQFIEKEHNWELEHPNDETCATCNKIVTYPPEITLRLVKKNFILRIENSDYVKQLLHTKKDGFAVELVVFNDYMCGNPRYYTKPSRRNGQCAINGKVLEPVYRNELIKGFKRRKRDKNFRFVNYIFGADSVPFFKRFWRFKMMKYSSQYFEFRLARLPRDFSGYFEHNLLYIQDEKVCHVDYFTWRCGEKITDERETEKFHPDSIGDFKFPLDTKVLRFTIPFEKNKTDFSAEELQFYIDPLTSLDFEVDSIFIKAYSSVEGDSAKNEELQLRRAQNMVEALQKEQITSIYMEVETFDSWRSFYDRIKMIPKWRFLAKYPKKELAPLINEKYADTLEPILKTQRKADVILKVSIPVNDKNRAYYIKKTWKNYSDTLFFRSLKEPKKFTLLKKLDRLYRYTYKYVLRNEIDSTIFDSLKMPRPYRDWSLLQEKFIWYGMEIPTVFQDNYLWKQNIEEEYDPLIEDFLEGEKGLSPEFVFNYCLNNYRELEADSSTTLKHWQRLFDLVNLLQPLYNKSKFAQENIKNLTFNVNVQLLNRGYFEDPYEHRGDARNALNYIIQFYRKEANFMPEKALALAKMCTYYTSYDLAFIVLDPFVKSDTFYPDLVGYYTILTYRHLSDDPGEAYYKELIALREKLGKEKWCNLFMGECGIPFQSFDHEELRDLFCKDCQEENEVLLDLLKK